MPNTIPKLVLQMRLKRAAELGMDYKTYAKVRQTSGRDVLGLLFSSNALQLFGRAEMPEREAEALEKVVGAGRLALAHRPLRPEHVAEANPVLDATGQAPVFTDGWGHIREAVQGIIHARGLSGSAVVVIGDAPLEHEWSTAGRAAAYLSAAEYFRNGAGR
ncbi:hypothetical protein [Phaeobacter sp. B1627]|uniref:hypothetical protein n=1 Tax=Phaeobacter sp. B1627 TaxID=2583809 RepID=UPI0021066E30|nr:hypothetical protein [Phaeobacter sp. B1627]